MARMRYSDEDILKLLREMEIHLSSGSDISSACRSVGIHQVCRDYKRGKNMREGQLSGEAV